MISALIPDLPLFWRSFADALASSIVIGSIVSGVAWLTSHADRVAARRTIAEHICRVFGKRLTPGGHLAPLSEDALKGWDALERLVTAVDLNRACLPSRKFLRLQDFVEELHRGFRTPDSLEGRLVMKLKPILRALVPRKTADSFIEYARKEGISLLRTAALSHRNRVVA